MLEALISVRPGGERGLKRRGDVLCVKLAGSPWGEVERRHHLVVEWDDAALESRLDAMQRSGDAMPVIALPYATYDATLNQTSRSTRFVDISALPPAVRAAVLDPTREVTKLRTSEYAKGNR